MSDQPDSVETFLAAIARVPADAQTACTGWTAHDVAAHLAAGFEEVNVLIDNKLSGRPSRDTRTFAEREAPYLAMGDDSLRQQLHTHLTMTRKVFADLRAAGEDAVFDFNGAEFTAAQMTAHRDGELALHRWDLVGDDDLSDELLSEPEFTRHAVFVLDALPMLIEAPTNRLGGTGLRGTSVVLRTPGQPDVALRVDDDGAGRFVHADGEGDLTGDLVVTTDAANRLLTLWGRRSNRRAISVSGNPALWGAVAAALWPAARDWS